MNTATRRVVQRGQKRCVTCGKVHDAHWRDEKRQTAGISWADPSDGHVYHQESWETVARRYGFTEALERDRFGVAE